MAQPNLVSRTWLDKAIGYLSPRAEFHRLQARAATNYLFSYEGARSSRRTSGWVTGSTSANAEVQGGIPRLRDRSRDLCRNNRYARKAVKELTAAIIGTGINAQAKTGDQKIDKIIQAEWDLFADECDAEGQLDFYGLQRMAARAVIETGEVLTRFRPRLLSDGLQVPLQLQVLESDFLDSSKNQTLSTGYIIQGIECDLLGRRRAYHLFGQHPGEVIVLPGRGLTSTPIPAKDILHVYDKERPGQMRGVPWLSAVILSLQDLDDYESAELFRKKVEACVVAFVTQGAGDTGGFPALGTQTTDTGVTPSKLVESFVPGMIERLAPGQNVEFNNPQPSGDSREYKTITLQGIAAGSDVTYERMTADYSNVTFSSWRGGDNGFKSNIEAFQWLMLVPMFMEPIWYRFIDTIRILGKVPSDTPYDVEFHMPPRPSIDPEGDAKAEELQLRTMTKTFKQAIIERGRDPESHCQEIEDSNKMLDAHGIISDADPRKTPAKASAGTPNAPPAPVPPSNPRTAKDEPKSGKVGKNPASASSNA